MFCVLILFAFRDGQCVSTVPGRRQAIICTNAGILLNGPVETNCSEVWTKMQFHTRKWAETDIKRGWVYMRTNLERAVSYEGMHYNQYDQVALF